MGCFGYICKGCGTAINGDALAGGEKCVMIHVRRGKEIGRVEGHYDEYGRVIEQEWLPEEDKYRGDSNGINGHSEICDSEFALEDSFFRLESLRIYQGEEIDYRQYYLATIRSFREQGLMLETATLEFLSNEEFYQQQFNDLPKVKREAYSGTAAWHSLCYNRADPEKKADLAPSESDPNQSWGRIRKKYK